MAKTFQLDVLTPERLFYSGPAEAITIQGRIISIWWLPFR